MKNANILVVGSINADMVISLPAVPQGGESTLARSLHRENGGKGANQAVAAARMGAATAFCAMIGRDESGSRLKQSIENEGIDTRFLFTHANEPTGLAVILLEDNGQNRIIVYSGANMELRVKKLKPVFEKKFDVLLIQLEIPTETILSACSSAVEKGMKVVLDAGPARPFPLESLPKIDILSPNRSEAEMLTGMLIESFEDAEQACRLLQERSGAQHIVLKMDKDGALLYNQHTCKIFPPFPAKIVDSTGAGDAFTAALTKWYTETEDIDLAITAANAAGSVAIGTLGAQPSLPTLEQVEKVLSGMNM